MSSLEDELLDRIGQDDPADPEWWFATYGAMGDRQFRDEWVIMLTAERIPATTLDAVHRWIANRLSVTLGAVRTEYNDRLREMHADEPETHGEWARELLGRLPDNFAADGCFWIYDEEERIFAPRSLERIANDISDSRGKNNQRASDYRAIAGLAYTIRAEETDASRMNPPPGIAAMDSFYRLTPDGLVEEELKREHLARFKIHSEPDEDEGLFTAFIERVADEDQQRLLRQHFAAVLFGVQWTMQKAVLWYGPGATGKSTLQAILETMVPEELISSVPPQEWEKEYHAAAMAGKVLNLVGEIEERSPLGAAFKNVTGGGRVNARHPTQQPFSFVSKAAQVFCSNYLPPSSDKSDAFWRRWSVVEFTQIVPEKERDPDLAHKIKKSELGKVLHFALLGAEDIINASSDGRWRFLQTARQAAVQTQWELEINTVAAFLNDEEYVAVGEDLMCGKSLFFKAYQRWCRDNNQYPLGLVKFRRELLVSLFSRYGVTEHQNESRVRVYRGVGLVLEERDETF